jgi:uncharacterized protein YjiS (DUF1127 family)
MSLVNLFVAARTAIKARRQRRRAFDELMALDDRSLADIGIHRTQIPALVMSFEEAVQLEAAPFTRPGTAFSRSAGFAHGHR